MAIPSVVQGIIETEDGKVFELDSPKGSVWLESISSFRFEPSGNNKPYTVRRESGVYWYGCRKVAGKVRKKYIGKSSEVNIARLEEIAEALDIPSAPRANKVAEVAQQVAGVAQDRLIVLEIQVANLQKAVEALQEALPGKLESGDSLELPKVDNGVAEQLQNELGNLKDENEKWQIDYTALLESSTHVTNKLQQELAEVRSQLETERASRVEIESELTAANGEIKNLENQLEDLFGEPTAQDAEIENLKSEIERLKSELADRSQTPTKNLAPTGKDFEALDAADLLNQLKARRKKSKADLGDVSYILEILEGEQ